MVRFAILFMISATISVATAGGKKRAVASEKAPLDTVTCRLKNQQGHFIRAERVRADLPLKVEIHLSGPKQSGYHGDYKAMPWNEARQDADVLKAARAAGVNLSQVDHVVFFILNGDGFTVLKFQSREKTLAAVLSILGSVHLCEGN